MSIESKSVKIDEEVMGAAGVSALSLVGVICAPMLAGPALIVGMVAGGIALKNPRTPNWVKAIIWGSFAGLYFIAVPAILTMLFGNDLGELAQLWLISKFVGGGCAIAGVVHLGLALKGIWRREAGAA